MQVKRRRAHVRTENASYWMSYSDIMAALLLMLVLLLFFYVNQYLALQGQREKELSLKEQELRAQQEMLDQAEQLLAENMDKLVAAQGLVNTQDAELKDKNRKLEDSLALLAEQRLELEEQQLLLAYALQDAERFREQLEQQELELNTRASQLTDKDKELLLQQIEVENLKSLLSSQTQELGQQQAMIDKMIGVRADIISQLRDSLNAARLNVAVDQSTGAITLDSAIFFDYGKSTIKDSGKVLLNEFIPIYVRTLLLGENSQYISELIVEGHTDSSGSYEYNLNLSQQRAYEVVLYCLSDSFTGLTRAEKDLLRKRVTANGRAYSAPVLNADGTENAAASRRVEFKFRLKDAEMIDSMSNILSGH